jgi:hypothetical protein
VIRRLKKMMDRPVIRDALRFLGAGKPTARAARGILREDGTAVPVEDIMRTFGVQKSVAEQIYKRRSK